MKVPQVCGWPSNVPKLRWRQHRLHAAKDASRSRFWEGDATKHFSVKFFFTEKGGGNSVKQFSEEVRANR